MSTPEELVLRLRNDRNVTLEGKNIAHLSNQNGVISLAGNTRDVLHPQPIKGPLTKLSSMNFNWRN